MLNEVTTAQEKKVIKDVSWGFLVKGASDEQKGIITGIWKSGCALLTRLPLVQGERIWIRAKDELGNALLSQVGTVVWNENRYSREGSRCEIRFNPLKL